VQSILISSGYPQHTLNALRKHFNVIDIVSQRQALAYMRAATDKPVAMSIGYASELPSRTDLNAREMLQEILKFDPDMPVIISTGTGEPAYIVELVKRGAFDYVVEPHDRSEEQSVAVYTQKLLHALTQAVRWRQVNDENRQLKQDLVRRRTPNLIRGKTRNMLDVLDLVRKVAPTPATVLITGESGTGKELIARTIHEQSDRCDEPFTAVNCAALTENLLSSELFGHDKGSFTGADADRAGLIREAGKGTLFLDEIGSVPKSFQAMLLRTLEQRVTRPVGGSREYPVHCRFIAAANQDLLGMVRKQEFREDFYYRLTTFHIDLPPLRDRRSDIPSLVHHFMHLASQQYDKPVQSIEPAAMSILESYDWPGNVRQLRNAIERAVIVCETDRLHVGDLDNTIRTSAILGHTDGDADYQQAMRTFETRLLRQTLQRTNKNLSEAARQLNMKRTTLSYRIKQLGLRDT